MWHTVAMSENLWKLRRMKGLTLEQLEVRTGIPVPVLRQYEAGRTLRPQDHVKLARALYVGVDVLKIRSDPPPMSPRSSDRGRGDLPSRGRPTSRPAPRPAARPPAQPKPGPAPAATASKEPAPVSETQLQAIDAVAKRLGMLPEELAADVGKPVQQLTAREARVWLREQYDRLSSQSSSNKMPGQSKRAALPEAVDAFELKYLTDAQQVGACLTVKLFNAETFSGRLIGFSPYALTLRLDDGREITLQKLAISYYTREAEAAA